MKKNIIIIILFSLLLKSCIPPLSKLYIRNLTNEKIILITKPSIESKLDLNGAKYDSIISMKINNSSEIGIYEIKPESKIYFYQLYGVNTKPQKHILYDEAKIIKSNDTISLNKENIKEFVVKKANYVYEIQIK